MSIKKNKDVAIVLASIDGVIGTHAGIGTVTKHFINQFSVIAENYINTQINLSLHLITTGDALEYPGYSKKTHKHTESLCRIHGGSLHIIEINSESRLSQNPTNYWTKVSKKSAEIIKDLANKYDQVIVYQVGLPFLMMPKYVNINNYCPLNITMTMLSSSDFYLFKSSPYKQHIKWEDESFKQVSRYKNTFMANISKYQIGLLRQQYRIPKNKIIPLQTGVYINDDFFQPISQSKIKQTLSRYNIPKDIDLIFSVARAAPPKGFKELLLSYNELLKIHDKPVHLVFVASNFLPFTSASVVDQLKQTITDYHLEDVCTPIYRYDIDLPKNMFQWKNTKIVAQLALQEAFGLVPEEARISPNKLGPVVVASNLGGFKEQITNGKDGFLVDPHNYLQAAKTMSKILNMSEPELAKIRKAGKARVKRDYDYTKNVIESLERLVE